MSSNPDNIEIKLNDLSDEQVEDLRKKGFKIECTYYHICPFCGKRIEKEKEKEALRSFNMHLGKCKQRKFWKALDNILPKGVRGGDVVYVLEGKFPDGYEPEPDNIEALEVLKDVYMNVEGNKK